MNKGYQVNDSKKMTPNPVRLSSRRSLKGLLDELSESTTTINLENKEIIVPNSPLGLGVIFKIN